MMSVGEERPDADSTWRLQNFVFSMKILVGNTCGSFERMERSAVFPFFLFLFFLLSPKEWNSRDFVHIHNPQIQM